MEKRPKSLQPFVRFCMTIGEIPTSYMNSMTYEEQLIWLCNFLEKEVIPVVNNNSEVVKELQEWFENLNVQDEVNNKIEEMYESGQLQEIITQYLEISGILGFNTINDMKQATNLINGSIARTIGSLSYNDGKGNFYKIRTLTSEDDIDEINIISLTNYPTLIAELLPNYYLQNLQSQINENYDTLDDKIDNNYNNLNERIDNLTNKKYCFIGDSYAQGYTPDGSVTPWQNYVKQIMNLNDNQFISYAQGGVAMDSSNSNNYYNFINTLNGDNDVTDVVICGGYNDINNSATEVTISQGISNVKTIVATKFPNAKLHIGFIGNSGIYNEKNRLPYKISYYINTCNNLGIHYLKGSELALHNYYSYFSSDNYHPNTQGQQSIAKIISEILLYGNADVILPPINLNPEFDSLGCFMKNDNLTLYFGGSIWNKGIEENVVANGSNPIKLIDVTQGYIKGNPNFKASIPLQSVVVHTSDNKYKSVPARLVIENNQLNIYFQLTNDAQNNFLTTNFTSVQINPFSHTFNSVLV